MRDCNFAEAQLTIVLVHSSRLFTEGLASLLKGINHNTVHQLTGFDSSYYPADKQEGKVVFVVGGRSPTEIVQIVKDIRSHLRSAYILVINASTEAKDVMAALEAGADGYLRDAISAQTLVRVIELIAEDETILPPEFVKRLRALRDAPVKEICDGHHDIENTNESAVATNEENFAKVKLSAREGSILRGLVDGAPNKVIAQNLQITEATVKVHVKAILRKIRVKNRTQAAIWGTKHLTFSEGATSDHESSPDIQLRDRRASKIAAVLARP
jgi:two-component system nitrate/nitrite response regulator NarL